MMDIITGRVPSLSQPTLCLRFVLELSHVRLEPRKVPLTAYCVLKISSLGALNRVRERALVLGSGSPRSHRKFESA